VTVDRGGLNYGIEVKDNFTAPLQAFKTQLASAQQTWDSFKASTSTSVKPVDAAAIQGLKDQKKGLQDLTTQYASLNKAKANTAKATEALGRKQTQHARTVKSTTSAMNGQASAANRLSFSFRRLFGILAAFTAARKVVQIFSEMIKGSVEFNKSIERMTLGIASLYTAVADVRDAQGNQLDIAQKLPAAIEASRKDMQKLRKDALLTSATFEQLVDTYQVALAPGLKAGLGVDQIRTFALRISQAAEALSVPQRQLSEEIRSILSGTIKPQNTRIAVALDITSEDIRTAKEMGTLADLLTKKFQAFGEAGKLIGQTFSVIVTRTKDAVKIVSGEGFIGLFDELKKSLQGVFDTLVEIDDLSGVPVINPNAVIVLRAMSDQLQQIVRLAKETILSLDFRILEGAAHALGVTLKVVGALVIGVVQGFLTVIGLIDIILQKLDKLAGGKLFAIFDAKEIAIAAALVTGILTTLKLFSGPLLAIKSAFLSTNVSILTLAGSLAAVYLLIQKITKISSGENLTLSGMIRLVKDTAVPAAKIKALEIEIGGLKQELDALQNKNTSKYNPLGLSFIEEAGKKEKEATNKRIQVLLEAIDNYNKQKDLLYKQISEDSPPGGKLAPDDNVFNDISKSVADLLDKIVSIKLPTDEFGKSMEDTGVLVTRMTKSLADAAGLVYDLNEELRKSKQAFEDSKGLLGLTGSILEQNKLRITASNTLYEKSKELQTEITNLESTKTGLLLQQARAEEKIGNLQAERMNSNDSKKLEIDKEIAALQKEQQERQALLKVIGEGEVSVKKDLLRLEELINSAMQERLRIQQNENTRQLGLESRRLEIDLLKAKQDLLLKNANQQTRDLKIATDNVDILVRQKQLAEEKRKVEEEAYRAEVARATASGNAENKAAAENQLNAVLQRNNKEREIENEHLKEANYLLDEQIKKEQQPIYFGALEGLRQFVKEAPTLFEIVSQNLTSMLQQVSQGVADIIVDSFDPTNNTSIAQAVGNLLKVLAKQILSQIISYFIAQLLIVILGLDTGAAGLTIAAASLVTSSITLKLASKSLGLAAAALGAVTLNPSAVALGTAAAVANTGGSVSALDAIFKNARGYSLGGIPNKPSPIRPKGLHPSDTVPIWADPKEWIIRAASVRKYGHHVLSALNQGLIDPASLRALATGHRYTPPRRHGTGFAEGGSVAGARGSRSTQGQSGASLVGAVMVANDETAKTMLDGGRYGVLKFMRENRSLIKGELGIA
jgi:hypothetical protein